MMELLIEILSWFLLVGGGIFMLIGGIGVIRLPDLYTRMHGASIIDTMGAVMMFAGMLLQAGFSIVAIKLGLIVFFLMFTSPTTTHALARAALNDGVHPLVEDDETEPTEEEKAVLEALKAEEERASSTL